MYEVTVLTTKQLARRWKIHPQTVLKMQKDGRLKGYQITRQWRFTLSEIEEYETSRHHPCGGDRMGATARPKNQQGE